MNKGLSVIICCYNSAWIIERTLNALKKQTFSNHFSWEIILVDNGCTDNTLEIASKVMNDTAIPFRIFKEKEAGLVNARKCGISHAQFDIVVFCDDDNLLCENYLETMYCIMLSDPTIGAAGGKGIPEFSIEPASIIKENLHCYAVGSQTGHDCWLYGAGLALRTVLVQKIYNQQHCYLIGRKGEELLSGDDSELVMSIVLRGYKIAPTDDVSFTHVLKDNRLSEDYFKQLIVGLTKPQPVFRVFRAVIYERTFRSIIIDYLNGWKSVIWSISHFWKDGSKDIGKKAYEKIILYNFWGLFSLWKIYKSWYEIKVSVQNDILQQ